MSGVYFALYLSGAHRRGVLCFGAGFRHRSFAIFPAPSCTSALSDGPVCLWSVFYRACGLLHLGSAGHHRQREHFSTATRYTLTPAFTPDRWPENENCSKRHFPDVESHHERCAAGKVLFTHRFSVGLDLFDMVLIVIYGDLAQPLWNAPPLFAMRSDRCGEIGNNGPVDTVEHLNDLSRG